MLGHLSSFFIGAAVMETLLGTEGLISLALPNVREAFESSVTLNDRRWLGILEL